MHLHDVFTPIEMADGLASASRVEKLISLMKQDKFCFATNINETTRCWYTVASILSATQNIDCLKQFTQLGGWNYLDSWLLKAQRRNINDGDSSVEELISQFMDALTKLPVKKEGLLGYGLPNTIRHFHCHKNVEIQMKAKKLSECWENFSAKNIEIEKSRKRICQDNLHSSCTTETFPDTEGEHSNSEWTITTFKGVTSSGDCTRDTTSSCKLQPSSSTSSPGVVHFKEVKDTRDIYSTERIGEATLRRGNTIRSKSLKEVTGLETLEDAEAPREGIVSATLNCVKSKTALETSRSFQHVEIKELDVKSRQSFRVNDAGDGSRSLMTGGLIDKHSKSQILFSNLVPIIAPVSSLDDGCQKGSHESYSCNNHNKGHYITGLIHGGIKCSLEEQPLKNMVLDMEIDDSSSYLKKSMPGKQIGSSIKNASVVLPGKQGTMGRASLNAGTVLYCDTGKSKLDISPDNSSTVERVDMVKLRRELTSAKPNREKERMETRHEPDGALEVARQVAIEVEREVGIYREASGSSSFMEDKNCKTLHFSSADSIEIRKYENSTKAGQRSELCSEQRIPDGCCSTKEEMDQEMSIGNKQFYSHVRGLPQENSKKMDETEDAVHGHESSQLTTIPEAAAVNDRTCHCKFDLNEDFQTEEVEYPGQSVIAIPSSSRLINLSTPIPLMATCRGPACLPTKPLHFEGELGWRGSAATSAFRPASLCKTSAKEKCLVEGNSPNLRHLEFRGINLNIADGGDGSVREHFPGNHVPVSSSLPSVDSSVEVVSRHVEVLNLDLNRLDDSGDNSPELLSDWRMEYRHHLQKNLHNPSSASSSLSVRDFDLNVNPSFGEAPDIHGSVKGIRPFKEGMVDNCVVTIMESEVPLGTNNALSAHQSDFGAVSHGEKECQLSAQSTVVTAHCAISSTEQIGRVVTVQPILAYVSPHASSHDGFGLGPSVNIPSVCPNIRPYMVDSHGATIKPQLYGSGTHYTFARAPYLIDDAGATGLNGVGMVRPSLDLNAGFTSLETETGAGNLRHLFFPCNNSIQDQMKLYQEVPMSGPSMKRKEPECGWDRHQIGHRHTTSWR